MLIRKVNVALSNRQVARHHVETEHAPDDFGGWYTRSVTILLDLVDDGADLSTSKFLPLVGILV